MSGQRYERVRKPRTTFITAATGSSRVDVITSTTTRSGDYICNILTRSSLQISISDGDNDTPLTPTVPNSPPPSFRSRASSPTRHANNNVDATLADTFDADGSDSDEDNDGDDRQRLMRGGPAGTPPSPRDRDMSDEGTGFIMGTDGTRRPPIVERRVTQIPGFAPTPGGRVYGGGNQSDGVFANLSAKPEAGEKLEEHPPVS